MKEKIVEMIREIDDNKILNILYEFIKRLK